ncbi:MAG: MerR family DNA-binding transcriptional regulator, partial [Fusobacteriaceae bacterium]
MKYYSTKEMVKILNVTSQTLRNWDSNGKLVPHHK